MTEKRTDTDLSVEKDRASGRKHKNRIPGSRKGVFRILRPEIRRAGVLLLAALLLFTACSGKEYETYQLGENTGSSGGMSGPFGKAGSGGGGGLEGTTRTAAEYEDEMVLTVLQNARLALLKEEDADEKEKQSQAQILSAYAAQGVSASADWKRRYYSVTLPNGNRVNAVAETRILSYEQPTLTGQMATGLEEKLGQAFSGLADSNLATLLSASCVSPGYF